MSHLYLNIEMFIGLSRSFRMINDGCLIYSFLYSDKNTTIDINRPGPIIVVNIH